MGGGQVGPQAALRRPEAQCSGAGHGKHKDLYGDCEASRKGGGALAQTDLGAAEGRGGGGPMGTAGAACATAATAAAWPLEEAVPAYRPFSRAVSALGGVRLGLPAGTYSPEWRAEMGVRMGAGAAAGAALL